jgi:hypothetical protein
VNAVFGIKAGMLDVRNGFVTIGFIGAGLKFPTHPGSLPARRSYNLEECSYNL